MNSMKIGKVVKYPIVSTSIPENTVLFRSYSGLVLIEIIFFLTLKVAQIFWVEKHE